MLPFDPKKPVYDAELRFLHANRHLHFFEDEENLCLLLRPTNAPEDWVGAFLADRSIYYLLNHWKSDVQMHIQAYIREKPLFRVFHLPDPREEEKCIWRILWRPDFAYAFPVGRPFLYQVIPSPPMALKGAFFWPRPLGFPFSFWKTPTQRIQQHFEQEWSDASSDVRAALLVCDLTDTERLWWSVNWRCGGPQELEEIMRIAFKCEANWPTNGTLSVAWHFTSTAAPKLNRAILITPTDEVYRWNLLDDHPDHRLSRLAKRLSQRNQGFIQPFSPRFYWDNNWKPGAPIGNPYVTTNRQIQVEPPTQHERMEAALLLRDWLRENAPDLLSDWF